STLTSANASGPLNFAIRIGSRGCGQGSQLILFPFPNLADVPAGETRRVRHSPDDRRLDSLNLASLDRASYRQKYPFPTCLPRPRHARLAAALSPLAPKSFPGRW